MVGNWRWWLSRSGGLQRSRSLAGSRWPDPGWTALETLDCRRRRGGRGGEEGRARRDGGKTLEEALPAPLGSRPISGQRFSGAPAQQISLERLGLVLEICYGDRPLRSPMARDEMARARQATLLLAAPRRKGARRRSRWAWMGTPSASETLPISATKLDGVRS